MGFGMSLCCSHSLRQTHSLRQSLALQQRLQMRQMLSHRLELALLQQISPPSGMSFKEPEPMKKIVRINGKRVIELSESEIFSYAGAVKKLSRMMQLAYPDVVLISMRGALPVFRSFMQFQDPAYLDTEYAYGRNWSKKTFDEGQSRTGKKKFYSAEPCSELEATLADSCKRFNNIMAESLWDAGLDFKMPGVLAIKAPTSYFLNNLTDCVGDSLQSALSPATLGQNVERMKLTMLFLDTSVTGTKLGWFMPQFLDIVENVAEKTRKMIHLISVIVNHARQDEQSAAMIENKGHGLYHTRVDLGVESLITEDSPTLLGSSYKASKISDKAKSEVAGAEQPKKVSIMVGDRLYDIKDEPTRSTAALFARIAAQEARMPSFGKSCQK